MKLRKFLRRIPILPLTALIFYLTFFLLWQINIIPSPAEIIVFLENLYNDYGLTSLFIASFLEGVVYLGLYFPGSFLAAFVVFLSDGKFFTLLSISSIITIALTLTSLINYFIGKYTIRNKYKKIPKKFKKIGKGIFLSILHPNFLAFYFFNEGLKKRNPWKIALVPFLAMPYYLIFAYIFYSLKNILKPVVESPYALITLIIIWFIVAFIFEHKRNK